MGTGMYCMPGRPIKKRKFLEVKDKNKMSFYG
jgi:hypothetical protein